jgi:arabinogalactan oligomer / maltooligosaccharide transport system permease protein
MLRVRRYTIFLFLLPTTLLVLLINIWPLVYTFNLSFTNKSLFRYDDYSYIGLKNYTDVLGSLHSDFYRVILLTLLYVAVCVSLFLLIGLATALALNNKRIKGLAFWRLAIILPWTIPSVISALVWKFFFNYDFGVINQFIRIFAGPKGGIEWLNGSGFTAFFAVVIVNIWLSYPFFTVIILGALQSVPAELTEAAEVDGATSVQRFMNVTLPLLRPAITPATILSAITTFQMFNTVYLITLGGPIDNPGHPGATTFVMIYMYKQVIGQGVTNTPYGYIAAVAVVIFVILFLMTLASLRASNVVSEVRR